VLAILLEEKHRQQAGARPAAGRDVERRRRLADLLAIPAGDFPRTCWITFQLRGITSKGLGDILSQLAQSGTAAAHAGGGSGLDHALAWQVLWEGLAPRALAGESRDIGGGAT
jgi:hypothetical protein